MTATKFDLSPETARFTSQMPLVVRRKWLAGVRRKAERRPMA
jgi:hypothetical protein